MQNTYLIVYLVFAFCLDCYPVLRGAAVLAHLLTGRGRVEEEHPLTTWLLSRCIFSPSQQRYSGTLCALSVPYFRLTSGHF